MAMLKFAGLVSSTFVGRTETHLPLNQPTTYHALQVAPKAGVDRSQSTMVLQTSMTRFTVALN
eukprot:1565420-Amphidinium_carterae.1